MYKRRLLDICRKLAQNQVLFSLQVLTMGPQKPSLGPENATVNKEFTGGERAIGI